MIIVDPVYDQFLDRYRKGVAGLVAGDPFDTKTTLAPLSSKGAAEEIKDMIREAVKLGAKAEEVGPPVPKKGASGSPLLTEVGEEVPPATGSSSDRSRRRSARRTRMTRRGSQRVALRLGGRRPPRPAGAAVAKKISTGTVVINYPTKVEADLLFGGIRRSGYPLAARPRAQGVVNYKVIDVVHSMLASEPVQAKSQGATTQEIPNDQDHEKQPSSTSSASR